MSGFSKLPKDLVPLIFSYLSKTEFNILVRVCRSLHQEITPYLYRDLTFRATKSRGCARKLALLLRTLLENPQLASYVRSFRLFGPHPCWVKFNPWPEDQRASPVNLWGLEGCTTLSRAQLIFASNQFYQLVDEDMHRSFAQYRGRSKDALATLVFTRCTQLTTLELGDGFLMYSLFLPQVLQRAPRLFPNIKHAIFGDKSSDPENTISYMDLDLIRPMFYIPTIESFEWRMTQPWQFEWKHPEAPCSESLTTLHLFRANISRAILAELLCATPQLKRFHYDQELHFHHTMPQQPSLSLYTNLRGLDTALHRVRSTLHEIELSYSLDSNSSTLQELQERTIPFPPIQGTLTVLRTMNNLRTINIPLIMILGWFSDFAARLEEVLPPSVQDLTLSNDFLCFCPWVSGFSCFKKIGLIAEYINEREIHAPNLRVMKLRMVGPKTNLWLEEAVMDMKAMVNGNGVKHWVHHDGVAEVHQWLLKEA